MGSSSHRLVSAVQGVSHYIEVDGSPFRINHDEGGVIRSPSPAVVVSVAVQPGDMVEPGDRLAVIEAMKMETHVTARFAGQVREVFVLPNTQVAMGMPLLALEPADDSPIDQSGHQGRFQPPRFRHR